MRRRVPALVGALFLGLLSGPAFAADAPKVLLIAAEQGVSLKFMLAREVSVMVGRLTEAGYRVVVASRTGTPIRAGNQVLTPDLKLSDVDVADYVGYVVPSMGIMWDEVTEESLVVLKAAAATGRPMAAQNGGVYILFRAGLLEGRRFAIEAEAKDAVTGGTYSGVGVVQDGNLLTSGTCPYKASSRSPDGTPELMTRFVALLGAAR
jgi:putative intracellular protease/amidase